MKTQFNYLVFQFLTALLLASCGITRPYKHPDIPDNNLYRDINTIDTSNLATIHWKELFTDTLLQKLIAEGIAHNLDLKIAYTNIQQAQAYYRQSRATLFPTLNANVSTTQSKISKHVSTAASTSHLYQLGISSSWEADVWGKLSSNKRASLANLLKTEAGARAVQTELVANIAGTYYLLLSLDQQLAITRQTVTNWDTTVQTMRALKEAATVTEAAVVQSEAQRYAAEVTIPDLEQSIRETENTLSILLGSKPTAIKRSELNNQHILGTLKTGLPAQLLANRPDVQQAELNFRNAFELTNVARAFFYPALLLSGSGGLASFKLSNLFDISSFTATISASLTQVILGQRVNRTRLLVAKAQEEAALLNFESVLLTAGKEVSDAISLHQTALQKISIRKNQINALEKSVEYTQELLQNGFANYTEVITARQSLLQAELGGVNDHLQQLQSIVNLYRALGGGWQ